PSRTWPTAHLPNCCSPRPTSTATSRSASRRVRPGAGRAGWRRRQRPDWASARAWTCWASRLLSWGRENGWSVTTNSTHWVRNEPEASARDPPSLTLPARTNCFRYADCMEENRHGPLAPQKHRWPSREPVSAASWDELTLEGEQRQRVSVADDPTL